MSLKDRLLRRTVIGRLHLGEQLRPRAQRGWLSRATIATVLDVGSHHGEFAGAIAQMLPGANVFSFEPLPDGQQAIRRRSGDKPGFRLFPVAVGERSAHADFHRGSFSKASSLLEMSALHRVGDNEFGGDTQRLLKPFTQCGGNGQIRMNNPNFFRSDYHGVTFKTEKRFSDGLGYIFMYTFSRWYDNAPFVGEDAASLGDHDWFQNIYDFESEWSLSGNHSPHRVVFSPVYELPFGRGKRFGSNVSGVANKILGGWQISGIYTFQTRSPYGVTAQNGPRDVKGDNAADAPLYANLIGDANAVDRGAPAPGGRRGTLWTNEGAFESPAPFTLGNAGRKAPGILGPGTPHIFNIAVSKNTQVTERVKMQFRWETFNSFNTPEFNNPRDQVGSPALAWSTPATRIARCSWD